MTTHRPASRPASSSARATSWRRRCFAGASSNDGVNNSYSFHFTQPFTWRRVYINANHQALSGFTTAGLGADFLIENATLFRHGAAGWNWNPIGNSGLVAAADAVSFTVARALLGQTAFPNVNSLAFEGESAGSPFQTTPSYEHVYTPNGPIAGYFAENDAANVYYQANFAANNAFKHVFIDSDASGASGYAFAGIGADFLIENDALYQHIGTGWNWARIADTPATGGATGIKSWTVPRTPPSERRTPAARRRTSSFTAAAAPPPKPRLPSSTTRTAAARARRPVAPRRRRCG